MTRVLEGFARMVSGRVSAWVLIVVAVLGSAAAIALSPEGRTTDAPTAGLPDSAQSTQVAELQQQLPSGQLNPAVVVYSRPGGLSEADLAVIAAQAPALRTVALDGQVTPPQPAPNREAALVVVQLSGTVPAEETVESVRQIREIVQADLPSGLTAQVTGGAGFTADLNLAFEGADYRLLLTTAIVVAVLLLITYRSPILWLIPLAVVGLADQLTATLLKITSELTDLPFNASTSGIVSVLVFGAGTDYALLLIARYREELRRERTRPVAMRRAWIGAAPAIAASSATVILALLTLLLAQTGSSRAIGVGGAIGIVTALIFGLLVLPAALVVCPRGIFWPLVPKVDPQDAHRRDGGRTWRRIGNATARRPWPVILGSVLLLVGLSTGLLTTSFGLSQADTFRTEAESVDGLKTISASFPAGVVSPVVIMTNPADAETVAAQAMSVSGVSAVRPGETTSEISELNVVITAEPDTPESYQTIRDLRTAVAKADPEALVGGAVATNLDARDAAIRDLKIISPLILAVVLVVLVALLRALVAPIVLILTVILSFFAAMGAGSFAFSYVFDYPGLDYQVPLFSFLFLVALGVDYNIFLVSRAKQETVHRGTRQGIIHALAVTGGVITSAGILLAAVFTVLGVLPVIVLTEIGIIVGLGVLLDTLLVRTVLVPASVHVLGDRFWAPGPLSRPRATRAADSELGADDDVAATTEREPRRALL